MTQRQFFFIFIMRSKGREREGGWMIASEFDDRSPAQMITRCKLVVSVVVAAFQPAVFRAAIPNR
jgi:hypothetical protein